MTTEREAIERLKSDNLVLRKQLDDYMRRCQLWADSAIHRDEYVHRLERENADRLARLERLEKVLRFGLDVMMPEIHAQRTLWPGEVDDFEERASEALEGRNDLSNSNHRG